MNSIRPRLEKILDMYGSVLHDAVCQREPKSKEALLSAKDLVQRFANADPTPGKSRTQWMVKTYCVDADFKLEDLGRAYQALVDFERFKRKLSVELRELSKLESLQELEALVDPFVQAEAKARLDMDLSSVTGREKRRLEEVKARDESVILQEGNGLATMVAPMTEFASCWWGRGTKWCTAAEKDNAFMRYYEFAPLIIVVCPNGVKFQVYVSSYKCLGDHYDIVQFMNAMDKSVSQHVVKEYWNELRPLLYWMVEQAGDALHFLPPEYITLDLCHHAVRNNKFALGYVPDRFKTEEICLTAVKNDGMALRYISEKYATLDICKKMSIRSAYFSYRYVPKKYRTLLVLVRCILSYFIMIYMTITSHLEFFIFNKRLEKKKSHHNILNNLKTQLQSSYILR
jgi:Domain of unknown function (DUF4116)